MLTSLANPVNPENDTSGEWWNWEAKFYRVYHREILSWFVIFFDERALALRSTLVFLFPRSFDSARANLGLRKWQRALLPKSLGFLLKMAVHWPEKHHLVSKTSVVLRRRVEHTRVPLRWIKRGAMISRSNSLELSFVRFDVNKFIWWWFAWQLSNR